MNILLDKEYIKNLCALKFPNVKVLAIEEFHTSNSVPSPTLVGYLGFPNVLYFGQIEIHQNIYLDDAFLNNGRGLKYKTSIILPTSNFITNTTFVKSTYRAIIHSQNVDTHYFQERASTFNDITTQLFKSIELTITDDLGNTPTYNSCSQTLNFLGYKIILKSSEV